MSLTFLPHFDVFCDLLLNRRTAKWNLFVLYNKETNYHRKSFLLFQNLSTWFESRPLPRTPTLTNTKKSHLTWSIDYTNKAISLVAMRSKRIVIGPRKSRHCQTCLERRSWWNENLQRKQNWTGKSTNLEEEIETVFVILAALWAEWLGRCLGYCRRWKSKLGKFVVAINTGGHSIRVLKWKKR